VFRITDKTIRKWERKKKSNKLIGVLQNKNDSIRSSAVRALVNIGHSAVEPLIKAFRDNKLHNMSDASLRSSIIEALDGIATRILGQNRRGKGTSVHAAAVCTLSRIGANVTVEPLCKALTDNNESVREIAAEALVEIGGDKAVQALIKALQNQYTVILSILTIKTLCKIGGDTAVEPLCRALKHNDQRIRATASSALVEINDKRAVEPLITALLDEDSGVRYVAVKALLEIGDDRAVGPLIAALDDKNSRVRLLAAKALVKIGDDRAVEPLIIALQDEDSGVRYVAVKALCKRNTMTIEQLCKALRDNDERIRELAAEALVEINDNRTVEPLITALDDKNSRVRFFAATALVKIGDKRAVEPLITASCDYGKDIRTLAIKGLGRIGDQRAAHFVVERLFAMQLKDYGYADFKNLFGDYTEIIVDICSDRGHWRYYTSCSQESDPALEKLCAISTPVSTNILHLVAKRKNIEVVVSEGFCQQPPTLREMSFEAHRQKATQELRKRGNPLYDESAFLDKEAWKLSGI